MWSAADVDVANEVTATVEVAVKVAVAVTIAVDDAAVVGGR
jgi:hypothetical protein